MSANHSSTQRTIKRFQTPAPPSNTNLPGRRAGEVSSGLRGSEGTSMASVFLYVPNLIGYLRLVLLFVAWIFYTDMFVFLPVYAVSAFLDCIDGWVARRLKQTSAFGAWLDVLVDNVGRSIIWTRLPYSGGVFVVCLEWTVFVCMHTTGHLWKNSFDSAPWWVKSVMDNGFYSVVGAFTISGIHGLPPYLYFYTYHITTPGLAFLLNSHIQILLVVPIVVLGAGRLLGLAVELWCIKEHALHLAHAEENSRVSSITQDLDRTET